VSAGGSLAVQRPLAERLRLIVIADPSATAGRPFLDVVRRALAAGAPAVQLRSKDASARELAEIGMILRAESHLRDALFFVNDRVDVALAVGADGAHLGSDDLPLRAARDIVPAGFLLGRSVDTPEEVPAAVAEGADYLGVGPYRSTGSKADVGPPIGSVGVAAVARVASIPVVAIGGVTVEDVGALLLGGACGVAVIRAVMAEEDPGAAVAGFLRALDPAAPARTTR
jgi:thiamine-phosphate pyrophosphorylase